jgi:hypothetical protein
MTATGIPDDERGGIDSILAIVAGAGLVRSRI